MSKKGNVEVITSDGIAAITFFHPKSNSMPSDLLHVLSEAITNAGKDSHAMVIVLKSKGDKAFCAGASFDELIEINDMETGKKFFMGFANVINAIRKCPKLVIVRVQAKAVGGSLGLISAADYALASTKASVRLSEFSLGIGPFVIGPAVERKIGISAFSAMSIDCEWRKAKWAKRIGLYNETYHTIEELDEAVQSLAKKISKFSPEAAREQKKMFWEGVEDWADLFHKRAETVGRLVMSGFTRNFIKQFKNR